MQLLVVPETHGIPPETIFCGDETLPVFGAENEMDVETREGLGHGLGRPFRAWWDGVAGFPGRCPGLGLRRAVGAARRGIIDAPPLLAGRGNQGRWGGLDRLKMGGGRVKNGDLTLCELGL